MAALSDPPPQRPDVGGLRPALYEEVVSRLPRSTAAPPAPVRVQSLGPCHPVVEEGSNCRMAREQLIVLLSSGLAHPTQFPPPEAGATGGR